MNPIAILVILAALLGGFGLYQFARREDAQNQLRAATELSKRATLANERIRAQAIAAQRESVRVEGAVSARAERATARQKVIREVTPHERSAKRPYANSDACVDPVLVSMLNAERADFPASYRVTSVDDQGQATAVCVTVRDLAEADRDAAQRYNDLAERHNSLVDQVTSHQSTSCHSKSYEVTSNHSTSHDYSSSDYGSSSDCSSSSSSDSGW